MCEGTTKEMTAIRQDLSVLDTHVHFGIGIAVVEINVVGGGSAAQSHRASGTFEGSVFAIELHPATGDADRTTFTNIKQSRRIAT